MQYRLGTYSDVEVDYRWKRGVGCCGIAWKNRHTTIYDSRHPDYKNPGCTLPKDAPRILKRVKSIVSVPILDEHTCEFLGVLSIDSRQNIDKTRFNEENILMEFEAAAKLAARILSLCSN